MAVAAADRRAAAAAHAARRLAGVALAARLTPARLMLAWLTPALLLSALLLMLALAAPPSQAAVEIGAAESCPPPLPPAATAPPAPAPDRGLLWRISRDGRTSYLFGTLHVGKPAWRHFGPQVTAALRQTDLLALEIDPADPALLQALVDDGAPLPLPPDLQARLAAAVARACIAPTALAALHPLLQAITLAVLEARWLGMDPGYALELMLAAHARGAGHRVVSLETAAQQKAALVPTDRATALAALDRSLAQLEDRSGRRVLAALAQAWEHGDAAALDGVEGLAATEDATGATTAAAAADDAAASADRALLRRLNDDRNPLLADGIDAWHRQGRRVFAAVGALHMTGPNALPLLLAQRGFKVERIAFAR